MPKMPPTFRPAHLGTAAQSRIEHDRRRGSARQRGYDARWDRASGLHKMAHPLCVGCMAVGRLAAVEVTDHIVPHRGDQTLFWDEANWQSSCAWHHDVVKSRLERDFEAGRLPRDALRLNSAAAQALTRHLAPTTA